MSTPDVTEPLPPVRTKVMMLTHLIRQAGHPDPGERDAAYAELYQYVKGSLRDVVAARVGQSGEPVAVTQAIDDAFASLFVDWHKLEVADTAHFRALMVRTAFWKATDQRRANRKLREAVTERAAPPAAAPGDARDVDEARERFERAVEALAAHEREQAGEMPPPTPLADVVKARHLAGGELSQRTFEQVGLALLIGPKAAHTRYWKAMEWLHAHFPEVVPRLPEKKKSGRRATDAGNGDSA